MRILLGITEGMVHTVHYAIGTWHKKRGALYQPGSYIKSSLPILTRCVHFMRTEPMQKERMKKQRQEPMSNEKT